MGPPAPPPLRGVEQQPRLIQRMESGYESSERNSSSPDRWEATSCSQLLRPVQVQDQTDCSFFFFFFSWVLSFHREVGQQKRALMSGPSWRSVPKSKSSGAILQELPSPSWGGGTNAGLHSRARRLPTFPPGALTCVCVHEQSAASWTSCRRRWRGEPGSRSSRSGGRRSERPPWDSTPNPASSWTWTSCSTRVGFPVQGTLQIQTFPDA